MADQLRRAARLAPNNPTVLGAFCIMHQAWSHIRINKKTKAPASRNNGTGTAVNDVMAVHFSGNRYTDELLSYIVAAAAQATAIGNGLAAAETSNESSIVSIEVSESTAFPEPIATGNELPPMTLTSSEGSTVSIQSVETASSEPTEASSDLHAKTSNQYPTVSVEIVESAALPELPLESPQLTAESPSSAISPASNVFAAIVKSPERLHSIYSAITFACWLITFSWGLISHYILRRPRKASAVKTSDQNHMDSILERLEKIEGSILESRRQVAPAENGNSGQDLLATVLQRLEQFESRAKAQPQTTPAHDKASGPNPLDIILKRLEQLGADRQTVPPHAAPAENGTSIQESLNAFAERLDRMDTNIQNVHLQTAPAQDETSGPNPLDIILARLEQLEADRQTVPPQIAPAENGTLVQDSLNAFAERLERMETNIENVHLQTAPAQGIASVQRSLHTIGERLQRSEWDRSNDRSMIIDLRDELMSAQANGHSDIIKVTTEQINRMASRLEMVTDNVQSLNDTVDDLGVKVEKTNAIYDQAARAEQESQDELEACRNRFRELENSLSTAKAVNRRLDEDLATARAEISDIGHLRAQAEQQQRSSTEAAAAKAESAAKTVEIARLNKTNASLTKQLNEAEASEVERSGILQRVHQTIQEAENNMQDLRNDLNSARADVQRLRSQRDEAIRENQANMETANVWLEEERIRHKDLLLRLQTVEAEKSSLETELEELKDQSSTGRDHGHQRTGNDQPWQDYSDGGRNRRRGHANRNTNANANAYSNGNHEQFDWSQEARQKAAEEQQRNAREKRSKQRRANVEYLQRRTKIAPWEKELGLEGGYDKAQLRKLYCDLSLKHHPDKNPGDEVNARERFQAMKAAYEGLMKAVFDDDVADRASK